jgi:hypothetical protein
VALLSPPYSESKNKSKGNQQNKAASWARHHNPPHPIFIPSSCISLFWINCCFYATSNTTLNFCLQELTGNLLLLGVKGKKVDGDTRRGVDTPQRLLPWRGRRVCVPLRCEKPHQKLSQRQWQDGNNCIFWAEQKTTQYFVGKGNESSGWITDVLLTLLSLCCSTVLCWTLAAFQFLNPTYSR